MPMQATVAYLEAQSDTDVRSLQRKLEEALRALAYAREDMSEMITKEEHEEEIDRERDCVREVEAERDDMIAERDKLASELASMGDNSATVAKCLELAAMNIDLEKRMTRCLESEAAANREAAKMIRLNVEWSDRVKLANEQARAWIGDEPSAVLTAAWWKETADKRAREVLDLRQELEAMKSKSPRRSRKNPAT